MPRAAIYARYSTDEQRTTSIDDQVRRTKEKAVALGYEVPEELIFSDAAQSGQSKSLSKRVGYARLLRTWDRDEFDALIVDEVCRLARSPVELANLQERIEKGKVRFITADGVDSTQPGWQLQFGFQGVIASHFIRETGHRVIRGMKGQLERGFMIAAPPFGYRLLRVGDELSGGTYWEIVEEDATWVKEIYAWRREGYSLSEIASRLNQAKVRVPRKPRKGVSYWRPATVRQIMRNTIYRGVFVWNGSAFTRDKSKRDRKVREAIDYPRPSLRLVSDEVWFDCNRSRFSRSGRASTKHLFAGLFSCGTCGATMSVTTGGATQTITCAQCNQAKRVGVPGRNGGYIAISGLRALLLFVLRRILSDEHVTAFREKLRERLEGRNEADLRQTRAEVTRLKRASDRFLGILKDVPDDDTLEAQYRETLSERRSAEKKLRAIEAGLALVDKKSIECQLAVNPIELLPRLFAPDAPVEKTRAVLTRLFPAIQFLGKTSRHTSRFLVRVAPGVVAAELSGTDVIERGEQQFNIEISTSAVRPTVWTVKEF